MSGHGYPAGRQVHRETNIGRRCVASWDFLNITERSAGDAFTGESTGGHFVNADGDEQLTFYVDAGGDPTARYNEVLFGADQGVETPDPRGTNRIDWRGTDLGAGRTFELIFRLTAAWAANDVIVWQYGQAIDLWRFGYNSPDFYFLGFDATYSFAAVGNADGGVPIDNTADTIQHMVGTMHYDRDAIDFYYQGSHVGTSTWSNPPMPTITEPPRGIELPIDGHTDSAGLIAFRVYDDAFTQAEVSELSNNFYTALHGSRNDAFVQLYQTAAAAPSGGMPVPAITQFARRFAA